MHKQLPQLCEIQLLLISSHHLHLYHIAEREGRKKGTLRHKYLNLISTEYLQLSSADLDQSLLLQVSILNVTSLFTYTQRTAKIKILLAV